MIISSRCFPRRLAHASLKSRHAERIERHEDDLVRSVGRPIRLQVGEEPEHEPRADARVSKSEALLDPVVVHRDESSQVRGPRDPEPGSRGGRLGRATFVRAEEGAGTRAPDASRRASAPGGGRGRARGRAGLRALRSGEGGGRARGVGGASVRAWIATLYSLVQSCRLASVDPFFYFRDALRRLPRHPQRLIGQLTPRGWADTFSTSAAA
jgi:hypothetical protein